MFLRGVVLKRNGYKKVSVSMLQHKIIFGFGDVGFLNCFFARKLYFYNGKTLCFKFFLPFYLKPLKIFFNMKGSLEKKELLSVVFNKKSEDVYKKIHHQWIKKVNNRVFREG